MTRTVVRYFVMTAAAVGALSAALCTWANWRAVNGSGRRSGWE